MMAVSLHVKIDIADAMRMVQSDLPKAVPYVMAATLSGMAQQVRDGTIKQLPIAFDRPTPFTLRSVFTKPATTYRLQSEVYFPESQEASGMARREYMRPGAEGTAARRQKRSEALLSKAGFLPPGWVTVPGRYAMASLLDGHGNIAGQYYRQIVRSLQLKTKVTRLAKPISAASQKRAARMGVENEFFAIAPGKNAMAAGGGWLPPGVYKREGKGGKVLRQYLKFVRRAAYKPRLDMQALAQKEVNQQAQAVFDKAFGQVMYKFAARDAKKWGLA
jgi:hypothetical protein